jgi:hypothetical protein
MIAAAAPRWRGDDDDRSRCSRGLGYCRRVLGNAMSTRGRQTAAAFGILLALSLPKQVPCEIPGATCEVIDDHRSCQPTDVEPFGVFLLEWIVRRDLPIAYSTHLECL